MSAYTWIITQDKVLGDSSGNVGRIGPQGAEDQIPFDSVIDNGEQFRLRNSSGQVKFIGYIWGEYSGQEPVEDFGREVGCDMIEYERNGEWISPD